MSFDNVNIFCSPFFHMMCAFLSLMAMKMTTTMRQRIRHATRKISRPEPLLPSSSLLKSLGRPGNRPCVLSLDTLQSPFKPVRLVLWAVYCIVPVLLKGMGSSVVSLKDVPPERWVRRILWNNWIHRWVHSVVQNSHKVALQFCFVFCPFLSLF